MRVRVPQKAWTQVRSRFLKERKKTTFPRSRGKRNAAQAEPTDRYLVYRNENRISYSETHSVSVSLSHTHFNRITLITRTLFQGNERKLSRNKNKWLASAWQWQVTQHFHIHYSHLIQLFQARNSKFLAYSFLQGQTNVCEFWESEDYF